MKKIHIILSSILVSCLSCLASTTFYHYDGNNNVSTLVNSSGQIVGQYAYDPYGNTISKTGTMADVNIYRFSAKEIQPTSGMYSYTYRFYSPSTHRWINQDPIGYGGGRNVYAFVGNDPINGYDPLGLDENIFETLGGAFFGEMDRYFDSLYKPTPPPDYPGLSFQNGPLGPGLYTDYNTPYVLSGEPSVTSIATVGLGGASALMKLAKWMTKGKCVIEASIPKDPLSDALSKANDTVENKAGIDTARQYLANLKNASANLSSSDSIPIPTHIGGGIDQTKLSEMISTINPTVRSISFENEGADAEVIGKRIAEGFRMNSDASDLGKLSRKNAMARIWLRSQGAYPDQASFLGTPPNWPTFPSTATKEEMFDGYRKYMRDMYEFRCQQKSK